MQSIKRQCVLIPHLFSQRIETQQESYCKGRARTEPRSSGEICNVMNLDPVVNSQKLQATSNGGMLNRAILINILNFRIRNAAVIFKKRRKGPTGDVTAFIDRRGQDGSTMFAVPDGVVGASTKKRDAEWGAGDNHALGFLFRNF